MLSLFTLQTLTGLVLFALVSSITPGPNNIMLLSSGVNFGFKRTIPHMLGICAGFFILCMATGLGIAAVLQQYPTLHIVLKIISALYLVYLAIQIARSQPVDSHEVATHRPLTFLQAALFQWVNPKAWMMALSAMIIYSSTLHPVASMWWISIVFAIINLPCIACWALFGVLLKQVLNRPAYLKWFNISMGILLVASIYPILK